MVGGPASAPQQLRPTHDWCLLDMLSVVELDSHSEDCCSLHFF